MSRRTYTGFLFKYLFRGNGLKHFLSLMSVFYVTGCIEPYDAGVDQDIRLITVDGSLVKGDSIQTVAISRTTSLDDPEFTPLRGCLVKVIDDLDNEFVFDENEEGTYSLPIMDHFLVYNRKYKLIFVTPEGERYESQFELLNRCPEIDTVYYEFEDQFDNFTRDELHGIQFYIDIKASDTLSRYYRWILNETWEYTANFPISYVYRDESFTVENFSNPYELFRCWITLNIPDLFISSTVNLRINEKKKIPLIYVSTLTDRLSIKYSLLVRQYAMNEGAYKYFQQNRRDTEESGGLYTQQPSQPLSNVFNVNDKNEKVLGYFWVASSTEKRIFVSKPSQLAIHLTPCYLDEFDPLFYLNGPFPVYIIIDEYGRHLTGRQHCFDCTMSGGKTTKPDFWE